MVIFHVFALAVLNISIHFYENDGEIFLFVILLTTLYTILKLELCSENCLQYDINVPVKLTTIISFTLITTDCHGFASVTLPPLQKSHVQYCYATEQITHGARVVC
jgi:hypothetical protein